jgi:biofilm PGA synthesis N-glycosyltransferase PgaC
MSGAAAIAFVLSAGCVAYVLFVYPLLLGLMARRRGRPVNKGEERKTVSVLIPVHNGEQFLREKLESVLAVDYPRELFDVLVVSDGSEDRTAEIAEEFAGRGVRLLRVPRGGKAAALNAGIPATRGEILLLTDVRQALDAGSMRLLAACFHDPAVGVVSGELIIRKGHSREESDVGLYWRYETWIRNQLGRIDSMFGATGPFYAMRRELAVPIPPEALLDDVYLPLAAFFRGYRLIVEEQAKAYDYPTALDSEFRRKVRTLGGNYQLLRFYPGLLGPANRMWFHYVSYKLGRLLLPWALVLAAISAWGLPEPWAGVALGGQAAFYVAALLDLWMPQAWLLKRVTSPARTFVVMMAAAVCAVAVFFVPPQSLWKQTTVRKPKAVS